METVIDDEQHRKVHRTQRWDRCRHAELLGQYRAAQGLSQRQAAKALDVPRTTLQAWHAWQDRLDARLLSSRFLRAFLVPPSSIDWSWRYMWCVSKSARVACAWCASCWR